MQLNLMMSLILGLVIGLMLGLFGIRKTQFEFTDEGWFYTPNAYLGISLLTLLVARVIYRLVEMSIDPSTITNSMDGFVLTPFTLVCFGLLAGYYIFYATGLILWRLKVLAKCK
jgi:membrane protein CcdC involved in cytochrome C biogenesis